MHLYKTVPQFCQQIPFRWKIYLLQELIKLGKIMRMNRLSTGWLLSGRKIFGSLCLLLLISAPVEAAERPKVFGVATERWYIQELPEGSISQDPDGRIWDYGLYLDL